MAKFILPRDLPGERHRAADEFEDGGRITVGRAPAAHMKTQGYEVLIDQEIGFGNYGVVVRAKLQTLDVACKIQPANDTAKVEVDALRNILTHENLVVVFAIFEAHPDYLQEGKVYIFMELMEGDLKNFVLAKGLLTDQEAKFYFEQIGAGLEYLHENGWAHRDIKADNVLLCKSQTVAKLTDFSISTRVLYTDNRRARSVSNVKVLERFDTLWKQSTEQGDDPQLGDVYCLGQTLFFMLEGHEEWEPPTQNQAQVSDSARDLIDILMSHRGETPTVTQALKHSWIRSQVRKRGPAAAPPSPVRHDRVTRLRAESAVDVLPPSFERGRNLRYPRRTISASAGSRGPDLGAPSRARSISYRPTQAESLGFSRLFMRHQEEESDVD